jgi:hypothetical protein
VMKSILKDAYWAVRTHKERGVVFVKVGIPRGESVKVGDDAYAYRTSPIGIVTQVGDNWMVLRFNAETLYRCAMATFLLDLIYNKG